ncbi:CEP68 protein, partial [Psilopogon haemacephalus]|nr:CEP68 protein [Psilopogon haemacephalus]
PLLDGHRTTECVREMSSYQANYWACAIPQSQLPSPDRHSPCWNPNKEYEDLLDYAYPLKPRYKLGNVPEPFLHDSGIGLDSFSASLEGNSRSTSIYGQGRQAQGGGGNGHHRLVASVERCSTAGPGRRGCSGASLCCEPLPVAEEFSFPRRASSHSPRSSAKDLMVESAGLDSSGHPAADGKSWHAKGSSFLSHKGQVKSTCRFLPTTGVLPLRKKWDADEEFLSLPPRLLELDGLAHFLSSLSLTVRMPVQSHQNPPRYPESRQPPASSAAPGGEVCGRGRRRNDGHYGRLEHPCSLCKPSWENNELCGQIHRDPLQGLHLAAGLRVMLDGMYLNEPWLKEHPKKSHEGESLAQCIKMFCCQLEELIRWLYNVVDTAGSWHPTSSGTEGMKALLHRYLEFRKDVASHRSLTKSVLERGEALLNCMTVSSPVLKDTLSLIVKQSEELETHAEYLYESVLAAAG